MNLDSFTKLGKWNILGLAGTLCLKNILLLSLHEYLLLVGGGGGGGGGREGSFDLSLWPEA